MNYKLIRPKHGILALYDDKIINMELVNIYQYTYCKRSICDASISFHYVWGHK